MKRLLVIGLFFLGLSSFAQYGEIKGIIKDGINNVNTPFVKVQLIENQDHKLIANTTTSDTAGKFVFKNVPMDYYSLSFSYVGYRQYVISDVKVSSDSTTTLEIKYPCPNGSKNAEKICPLRHTDGIIPIAYGEPTKKTMKKAQSGEIYLGGCVITGDCDPSWFCKKHNIAF